MTQATREPPTLAEIQAALARWKEYESLLRGLELRAYAKRFNATFPECDANCVTRDNQPSRKPDRMMRAFTPGPVATYTGAQAASLPASQPTLAHTRLWADMAREQAASAERIARAMRRSEQDVTEARDREPDYTGPEFAFADVTPTGHKKVEASKPHDRPQSFPLLYRNNPPIRQPNSTTETPHANPDRTR